MLSPFTYTKEQTEILQRILEVALPGEEWRPTASAPEHYWVSTLGRPYSVITHKIMSPFKNREGYYIVSCASFLRDMGLHDLYIHREVAKAFLVKPPGKDLVCHKDDDRSNNTVQNLYWGSHKDNQLDAERNNRPNYTMRKPCKSTCLKTGAVRYYRSVTDVEAEGLNRSNVKSVCKTYEKMKETGQKVNGRKSEAGRKWEFITIEEYDSYQR